MKKIISKIRSKNEGMKAKIEDESWKLLGRIYHVYGDDYAKINKYLKGILMNEKMSLAATFIIMPICLLALFLSPMKVLSLLLAGVIFGYGQKNFYNIKLIQRTIEKKEFILNCKPKNSFLPPAQSQEDNPQSKSNTYNKGPNKQNKKGLPFSYKYIPKKNGIEQSSTSYFKYNGKIYKLTKKQKNI